MVRLVEEEDTWSKLPRDLQEQFYKKAEEESSRLMERILEVDAQVRRIKPYLEPHISPLKKSSESIKIAAVDGSVDPVPSDRLGVRYGTYSAGYIILEGKSLVDEGYVGGSRRVEQSSSLQGMATLLSLLMTAAERKAALAILGKADLVVIDGAFYSYMYRVFELPEEARSSYSGIVDSITKMTEQLIASGKCLGMIKRSRTRAIGAWDSRRINQVSPLVKILDKLILTAITSNAGFIDYTTFLGSPIMVHIYSRISKRLLARPVDEVKKFLDALTKGKLEDELNAFLNIFQRSLGYSEDKAKSMLGDLERMQVQALPGTPPVEVETATTVDRRVLEKFLGNGANFNPATGLPYALDLIDDSVKIPRGFSRDFTEEIEARILGNSSKLDQDSVRRFFAYINPQKQYMT